MKKSLVYFLTAAMALSITACGGKATETTAEETAIEETTMEETSEAETEEASESEEETENSADGETTSVAHTLLADFHTLAEENADMSAQEIAASIISNEIILFAADTVPVEEGLLTGFGNTEITGFEDGAMFGPIIGSIPFVGYIFEASDEAAADELSALLEENANPRWNVCTEAEETVVETDGNKVFFVMSPISLED